MPKRQMYGCMRRSVVTYRSDLQPPVGSREEEVGGVVGVRQLQHTLLKAGLVSGDGDGRGRKVARRHNIEHGYLCVYLDTFYPT